MDSFSSSGANKEDNFADGLSDRFDVFLWMQRVSLAAVLLSIADLAWEYHTGIVKVHSRVQSHVANRASQPEAFQRLVTLEVYRTVGILIVALALKAVHKSVARYDIFAPGQEFKSLDAKGKS